MGLEDIFCCNNVPLTCLTNFGSNHSNIGAEYEVHCTTPSSRSQTAAVKSGKNRDDRKSEETFVVRLTGVLCCWVLEGKLLHLLAVQKNEKASLEESWKLNSPRRHGNISGLTNICNSMEKNSQQDLFPNT